MRKVSNRAHGIDISKYDRWFRPEAAVKQLDFVVQRLGYGLRRDEAFDVLKPGVMKVPIRGGYWYLNSGIDWRRQMDMFLQVAGNDYHFLAVDFEKAFNVMTLRFAEDLGKCLEYLDDRFKGRVLFYTNKSIYQQWLSYRKWAAMFEFWYAQYFWRVDPDRDPVLPHNRPQWTLWQYTSKGNGREYGLSRENAADLNVFHGSVDAMRKWAQLDVIVPPPPPPTLEERVEALEAKAHEH